MKTNLKNHLAAFAAIVTFACPHISLAQQNSAPPAFLAMAKKLESLKSISYNSYREINNITDNYFAKQSATCYIEFNQVDKLSVSRFRMEAADYISVYNGTESFGLSKTKKTYTLTERIDPKSFGSNSYFFNSIPTIRSVAQQIAESDTIPKHQRDTVIDGKNYKLVQVDLHRSSLQYMGSTMHFTKDVTISYRIVIDPETWLPYQVLERNNINKDGYNTKVVFTDINTNPKQPDEYSWYYTTYLKDYQPEKQEKREPLIATGAILLDWGLPEFGTDKQLTAADVKGKLVLLDFWIKNCGPCMESFPVLRRLQKTYGGDKFQLLSINAYDKKEEIAFFYKREKPAYKMLYNGLSWSKGIGVSYYPTAILIDKTGKVIYSGGFEHEKIEALIKANL
ncbi:TlpA family protein disulfide reductase [Mucilaginibacter mali]|uniref:TlpA family protein disulfide reductase n=1 Tax=Mucilaginibacter mali TaxID=2740462 RepID=A0A7D4PXB3_9SPHI|nr:TlpA disulfide reductase family protein [Mucilaginibacter mali]QKJ32343.1 TlpA family protein disulfide reductase [Mucilaginibacter mali]